MSRTKVDFSEHKLEETITDHVKIWNFSIPNNYHKSVIFINCQSVMTVTGDFGNFVFSREFHPSKDGGVSDDYWVTKMQYNSCQKPLVFDSKNTLENIKEFREDLDYHNELSEEIKDYLCELERCCVGQEFEYDSVAYDNPPIDLERFLKGYRLCDFLLPVFDAFDEICKYIKNKQEVN